MLHSRGSRRWGAQWPPAVQRGRGESEKGIGWETRAGRLGSGVVTCVATKLPWESRVIAWRASCEAVPETVFTLTAGGVGRGRALECSPASDRRRTRSSVRSRPFAHEGLMSRQCCESAQTRAKTGIKTHVSPWHIRSLTVPGTVVHLAHQGLMHDSYCESAQKRAKTRIKTHVSPWRIRSLTVPGTVVPLVYQGLTPNSCSESAQERAKPGIRTHLRPWRIRSLTVPGTVDLIAPQALSFDSVGLDCAHPPCALAQSASTYVASSRGRDRPCGQAAHPCGRRRGFRAIFR
jgi:hypothetical protein